MTDCTRGDIRDLLPELLTGTLDASARADAERHVRDCPVCADELALLRTARAALSRTPSVDTARIARAIERGARAPVDARRRTRWATRHIAAIAAALLVMLTGAVIALSMRGARPEVAQAPTVPVATPEGGRTTTPLVTPPEAPTPRALAVAPTTPESSTPRAAVPDETPMSLAFASADLEEAELESLLADLGSLDGIPDADPAALLPELPVEVQ